MDFGARIPKDKKQDAEGLWGWESPRLKAALAEAKKSAAPKTANGVKVEPNTWFNPPMLRRDGATGLTEPAAEGGCRPLSNSVARYSVVKRHLIGELTWEEATALLSRMPL